MRTFVRKKITNYSSEECTGYRKVDFDELVLFNFGDLRMTSSELALKH